ncbi:MAG: Nif11-like leader peptide family RiPP precursor [Bacillota bacterium]
MSQMKQLYNKVAHDNVLQLKFVKIIENHDHMSNSAIGDRLVEFAKDAGFQVTKEEIKGFFTELTEQQNELSDADLEMVAGGKGPNGISITYLAGLNF